MTQQKLLMSAAAGLFVLLIAVFSMFTVAEWERAAVFQLGELVRVETEPGLKWKVPFFQNVRKFDGRILTVSQQSTRYLTSESKNLIVDFFIKWQISDVSKFYNAFSTGGIGAANDRLVQSVRDKLQTEFRRRTIQEVIAGERNDVMAAAALIANQIMQGNGIKVVDVRLTRVDFPEDVSNSVYQRMQSERLRAAKDFRSRGAEVSERIRADADRQRTVVLAEAYRDAERIRGEGDAEASQIYAEAFKKNPEFYAFYRSMTAYKQSFKESSDMIVLDPSSDFLKYFKNPNVK